MIAGILRSREGWHIEQLEMALHRRGIDCVKFTITDLVLKVGSEPYVSADGHDLTKLDAVIVRVIPLGSMEQLMFRLNTLHHLEKLGVQVINSPGAIEKTVDKSYTSSLLEEAGLNTPYTVVCERFDEAMAAFEELGDVIVKPLSGSCGAGMTRITDVDIAYRVFRAMEQNRFVYYLQEFVDCGEQSVRIFVAQGEVAGAMKRRGTGWKISYNGGALVEPHEPDPGQIESAKKAAAVIGLDYAGVDLLVATDGTEYIIEVNGIPGWKGLQQTTSVQIADKIAGCIINETVKTAEDRRSR